MNELHPSRRRFLIATGATIFTLPRGLRAQEPLTYLQVAAAVVGIVAGIAGLASDSALRSGIDKLSAKLDVVIAYQIEILKEIEALRLYFDLANFIAWRDAYSRSLTAFRQQLNEYLAEYKESKGSLNTRLRNDFEDLSREADHVTLATGQMDPWAFAAFGTGVAIVLISERILKGSPGRIRVVKNNYLVHINNWLGASPKSLPKLIGETTSLIAQRSAALPWNRS